MSQDTPPESRIWWITNYHEIDQSQSQRDRGSDGLHVADLRYRLTTTKAEPQTRT